MKKFLSVLLAILCITSLIPAALVSASAQGESVFELPAEYAEATHVAFADQWQGLTAEDTEYGSTNARKGEAAEFAGEPYVYLKGDDRGDFSVKFTVANDSTYAFGFTLFVLGSGTMRATRFKIDDGEFVDFRFNNTEAEMASRQYVVGYTYALAAGEHTMTLSLPADFDNSSVKTLYIRDFFYYDTDPVTYLQFKYSETFNALDEAPSYLAEATEIYFADQWEGLTPEDTEYGSTNARRNIAPDVFPDCYYVYLKQDDRGDYTVSYEIEEEGWYNFGMLLYVLATGTTRSTYLQIDDSMAIDIRFTNTEEEYGRKQYVSGLTAYMTAGTHTATISLTEDFDNETVKSLYFRALLFQKTTESFIYHHFGEWETVKEPTCTETGTAKRVCTDDGCDETEEKTLAAKGHTSKTVKSVPATCTETGLKAGKVCGVCGEVLKEQEVIPATGHNFGEWEVTTPATTTSTGIKTRKCKNCDETETEEIPKLSEEPTPSVTAEPSATDAPSSEPTAPSEKSGSPVAIIVIIVVAVIAILACVYFFVIRKKK